MSEFSVRLDEHKAYEDTVRDTATSVAVASDAISTVKIPGNTIFGVIMTPLLSPMLSMVAEYAENVVAGLVTQGDGLADGLAHARENYRNADDDLSRQLKGLSSENLIEPTILY
jgi:hypothetical protein